MDCKIFKSLIVVTTDDEILDCRKLDATTDEAKLHYTIKKAIEGEVKPGEYIVFEIEDDINGIGQKNSKPIEVEVCFSPAILDIEKALAFKFKVFICVFILLCCLLTINVDCGRITSETCGEI